MGLANYLFLFLFPSFLAFCAGGVDHQTAFVQTEDGLHYFVDAQQLQETAGLVSPVAFSKSANAVDASVNEASQSINQLTFDPVVLHFDEHAIGIPHLHKVTVRNPTASKVRFDAISGSTVHFHCSFFEQKTVDPNAETTFDVVFLPRQEGSIENTLFIHSSLGTFSYTVTGVGISNPYRLRPFVGARIPLNTTFVSPLVLHNPHPTPLRITEMYSSGGDLHLELPQKSGVEDTTWKLWEIPPFQSKTVMQARFVAAKERNATAYIRIKTDRLCSRNTNAHMSRDPVSTVWNEDTIVLPVEIEVTNKRGIFPSVYVVDFGFIRNDETSKMIDLRVVSNINRTIEVDSIVSEPPNPALYFQYEDRIIPPLAGLKGDRESAKIGTALLHGSKLEEKPKIGSKRISGKIVIKSKGGKYKLSVPYSANVFHGQLLHDSQQTAFYAGHSPPAEHNVTLKNTFPVPLAIYNVSLPRTARKTFVTRNMKKPVVIRPGEARTVFALGYEHAKAAPHSSFCRIYTNLSNFDLPIAIFNGKLRMTLYSIEQDEFDFGLLDEGDKRGIQFAVTNENPVPIALRHSRSTMEMFTSLRLIGVESGNETVLAHPAPDNRTAHDELVAGDEFHIPAHSFGVFELILIGPRVTKMMGPFNVIFHTPYETRTYPVKMHLEEGAIVSIPEKIYFPDSFPGRMSSQPLQVYSTFGREMPLLRLSTMSHDPRIFFESFDQTQPSPVIKPGEMSYLGRVLFFPIAGCMDDCYVGVPLHTNEGAWFTYGMRLPVNLPEIDAYLYQRIRKRWIAMQQRGEHVVNATVVVDSTLVKHFQIPAQGRLVWPKLMKQTSVHFPLTAVGNFTIVNLTLHNPSNLPVVVQLLPLTIYPDPEGLLHYFRDELPSPLTENVEINETLMFTLRDTELFNLRPDSPVPKFRQQLEQAIGVQVPRFTLSMILQPNMKVRVRVGFLPKDYDLRSSLLLIRNNLTVLEPVVLYGRGATVELRVGNRMPRSSQPLLFEIQEMHLLDCQNPKRLTHRLLTTLTVRRSFVARNTGEVTVTITHININGLSCEGRGFRVLNCVSFRLKPNETHILEIAYTPDFTMSWNEAALQLYMHGNSSAWVYPLAAALPKEWLPKCQAALPRPHWESLLYYSCVTALVFLLICIVASAYLEGDRIITCALRQQVRFRRVFDLNNLSNNEPQPIPTKTPTRDNNPTPNKKPQTALGANSWSAMADKVIEVGKVWWNNNRKESNINTAQPSPTSKPPVRSSNHTVASKSEPKSNRAHHKNQAQRKSSVDENNASNQKRGKKQQYNKSRQHSPKPEPPDPQPTISIRRDHMGLEEWEIVERPKKQPKPTESAPPPPAPVANAKPQRSAEKDKKMLHRKTSGSNRSDVDSAGSSASNRTDKHREKNTRTPPKAESDVSSRRPSEEEKPAKRSDVGDLSYANVAKMTPKSRSAASASESDDSAPPEWDSAPIATDNSNYDDAFEQMHQESQSFASLVHMYEGAPIVMTHKPPPPLIRSQRRMPVEQMPSPVADSSSSRSDSCSSPEASGSSSPTPKNRKPTSSNRAKKRQTQTLANGGSSSSGAPSPPPCALVMQKEQRQIDAKKKNQQTNRRQRNEPATAVAQKPSRRSKAGVIGSGQKGQKSLIQQLQADRKRRLTEFYKQKKTEPEEEWPGFGLSPVTESLWDEEHEPWNLALDTHVWDIPNPDASDKTSSPSVFRLNPAAPPFVSRNSNLSSAEASPKRTKVTPPPFDDSSIVAWAPSADTNAETETTEQVLDSGALSLAGSLFSAGIGRIWDPNEPVNPERSWATARLGSDEEEGEK